MTLTAAPHEHNLSNAEFCLHQNDPNPFSGVTKIKLRLPIESKVTVLITDSYGKVIDKLISNKLSPGIYEIEFYAEGLIRGTYFYHLVADNYSGTKAMELTK